MADTSSQQGSKRTACSPREYPGPAVHPFRKESIHVHVGGIDGATGELVDWSVPSIVVGDEVSVKVVEAECVSPEHRRQVVDPELFEDERRRQQKRHREQRGE